MSTTKLASPGLRQRLGAFIYQDWVQRLILILILINAVILGLETAPAVMAAYGEALLLADKLILAVFVAEIGIRLYVHRLDFFRDPWSVFDFLVVAIALVPATGQLSVLRALRVLRVLRVLTIVPALRQVVGALLSAIPGLGSIAVVLLLLFYVFAVIATNLFGATHPDWFGDIGRSLYTLFQIMTLESWSMGIARPVMESHPYAWAFFIPFILIATFTMLNLFIAIIVNAMQGFSEAEQAQTMAAVDGARQHIEADLHTEMAALRQELTALRAILEGQRRV